MLKGVRVLLFQEGACMHVVVELMLGMLMGVYGPFRTRAAADKYCAGENGKLKRSGDTYYQVWPLKEMNRAKGTSKA